jgi:hypothetical protein
MVKVQKTSLPTYFSRIWGATGSSVSATATAEVFNPSGSELQSSTGNLVPVQPRCVKPWVVPNADPNPSALGPGFVSTADGSIINPGIIVSGSPGTGVIGDTFTLVPDCSTPSPGPCPGPGPPPFQNPPTGTAGKLQYLPGVVPATSAAAPSCATATPYQEAIAGCDQATQYQCGVQSALLSNPNEVDVSENPGGPSGDTVVATECLLNRSAGASDSLDTTVYPYQIKAGAANPLNVSGAIITNSNSIVTVPIIDNPPTGLTYVGTQAKVTVVGFLQLFINNLLPDGTMNVTVVNVAGCGTGVPNGTTPVYGTSPVPVRLITPP